MGREVRSRFPQPVPDRSPPTLLRPLCLVWGGTALCRGVTPSSTGSWLPSPLHLAAYTRAELCSPIRNICSPEGRTVTPRLGCQNQPPSHSSAPQLGWAAALQPLHGTTATSGTGDPQGLQSKLTPPVPTGLNQLLKVKVTPGSSGHCGSVPAGRAARPLPHPHGGRHSSAPPAPSLTLAPYGAQPLPRIQQGRL